MAVKLHCGHWGERCSSCGIVNCFICDGIHHCVLRTDRVIWGALAVMTAAFLLLAWLY